MIKIAFKQEVTRILNANKISFILIIALMIISGFVQATSIIGLMPIVDFVINNDIEKANQVTKFVATLISNLNLPVNIITMCSFYLSLVLTKSAILVLQRYYTSKVHFKIMKQIIFEEYQAFLNASWKFFGVKKYGTLSNTVVKETEKASLAFEAIAAILAAIITLIFYAILAALISWQMIILILIVTLVFVSPTIFLGKYIYRIRDIHTNAMNDFQGEVYNSLNAIKLIVGFDQRRNTINKIKNTINKIAETSVQFTLVKVLSNVLVEPVSILLVVLSVIIGTNVYNLDLTQLFIFLYAINRLTSQIQIIISQRNELYGAKPSLNQIYSLKSEADALKEITGEIIINKFKEIKFSNASFSYGEGKEALTNINLSIPNGKMIAIVGPSGSGKSTLIDLIMGFYYTSSGILKIDSTPFNEINLKEWRNIIGYIPQQPFLFNSTIKENLQWAKPEATDAEIINACKLANANDFINSLDSQYETIVGERGVKLSGGQAQRLCMARALIKNPEILIFDEATSSLDSHSEKMIQKSIEYLARKTTIIVIAHRLSTIKNADYIYHIEGGEIVEQGTFQELLIIQDGLFNRSAKLQGIT